MKKDRLDDYEIFYMEIRQTADYLDGMNTGIEDAREPTGYDEVPGLSDDQVSKLASDQLDEAPQPPAAEGQEELFKDKDNS